MPALIAHHSEPLEREFRNVYQAMSRLERARRDPAGVGPGVQEDQGPAHFVYPINIVTPSTYVSGRMTYFVVAVLSGPYIISDLTLWIVYRDALDALTEVTFALLTTAARSHPDAEHHPGEVLPAKSLGVWSWDANTIGGVADLREPMNVVDGDTLRLRVYAQHRASGGATFAYKAVLAGVYLPMDPFNFPTGVGV
jgi:hypothetical protein